MLNFQISFFMSAVYQLFASLMCFIYSEKQKSSTEMLKNVIDEWDTLFAREVNVVLFKSFYQVTNEEANVDKDFLVCHQALLESIIPTLEFIDYSFIYSVSFINFIDKKKTSFNCYLLSFRFIVLQVAQRQNQFGPFMQLSAEATS